MKIILISAVAAVVVCIIIGALVIINLNKKAHAQAEPEKESIDINSLETNFKNLCDNTGNDYVATLYDITEEENGKYNIEAKIPYVKIDEQIDAKINAEINNLFVTTLLKIYDQSEQYTRLEINYASSVNNEVLSLMIRCILKQGANAQRTIIKTYNYSLTDYKEISVLNLFSNERKQELQEEIYQKIQKEIDKENRLSQQGYSSYKRDANSEIYLLENATEFYIKDNVLYIIYSYGNRNYTSTVDLIITEI